MDALEPSQAMLAIATAKNIYTKCIQACLDNHGTSIENGQYAVCTTTNNLYIRDI